MPVYSTFEELEIFKLSRTLTQEIWNLLNQGTFRKDYNLKNQIDRSSSSVMDNIAEGFGRGGNREFINFLSIARGSCCETKSQFLRAIDRKYVAKQKAAEITHLIDSLISQLTRFMRYLNKSKKKGIKFNT